MFKQHLLFLQYNKNVFCVIDKDRFPICKMTASAVRLANRLNMNVPSYEPYIPRPNSVFYNCSTLNCEPYRLFSMTQLSNPTSNLKNCYLETPKKYTCESVKYNYYKNVDKLLFLANNIPNHNFYLVDCLLYAGGERVCQKKDNINSHTKLVDFGIIARPNDDNVLSQDELLCEETDDKRVNCDFNLFVPYATGLKKRKPIMVIDKILLKTGPHLVLLNLKCNNGWCGYSGGLQMTRRLMNNREHYEPPGGSVYRCYYAKRQQICKKLYGPVRNVYNERAWLNFN